jgi:hypothetical protein
MVKRLFRSTRAVLTDVCKKLSLALTQDVMNTADVEEIFKCMKAYEDDHCAGNVIQEYTEYICNRLDELADLPEYKGLRVFHRCFGTWAETIYRIIKLDSAAFFCAKKEHIINNEGRGGNGKSLHQYFCIQMFGHYSNIVARGLLQSGPPPPGSPCPELVALRGARMLFTPEAEKGKPVSPALLKDIRDPSTLWRARDLYESGKVPFQIPAILDINSNDYVDIASIDGGVRRSLRAVPWAKDMGGVEGISTGDIEEAMRRGAVKHERVAKTTAMIHPWRPGMLKLWVAAWNVWHRDSDSSYVEPTPQSVKEKTDQVLAGGACAGVIKSFLAGLIVATSTMQTATLHEMTEQLYNNLDRYGVKDKARVRSLLRLSLMENADGSVSRVNSSVRLALQPEVDA